jgi:hypothetical protein
VTLALKSIDQESAWKRPQSVFTDSWAPPLQAMLLGDLDVCGSTLQIVLAVWHTLFKFKVKINQKCAKRAF